MLSSASYTIIPLLTFIENKNSNFLNGSHLPNDIRRNNVHGFPRNLYSKLKPIDTSISTWYIINFQATAYFFIKNLFNKL